jgi:hypothetical protein
MKDKREVEKPIMIYHKQQMSVKDVKEYIEEDCGQDASIYTFMHIPELVDGNMILDISLEDLPLVLPRLVYYTNDWVSAPHEYLSQDSKYAYYKLC